MLTLVKACSVALAAGALSFLIAEWRFYRTTFSNKTGPNFVPRVPDSARLIRRTVGSTLLFVMSLLMFLGRLPESHQVPAEDVLTMFYYWAAVFALAMLLTMIAFYDAVAGVKKISSMATLEQAKELSALAEQLRRGESSGRSPAHKEPTLPVED